MNTQNKKNNHLSRSCGPHCDHGSDSNYVYEYGRIAKVKPFCFTTIEEEFFFNFEQSQGAPIHRTMEKMDTFNPHMVAESVCPR